MTISRLIPLEEIPEANLCHKIMNCTDAIVLSTYLVMGLKQFPNADWTGLVGERIMQLENLIEVDEFQERKDCEYMKISERK